ncbi:MAG: GNAT family N-acetyltransferase [Planctomycetaceae bacterium]
MLEVRTYEGDADELSRFVGSVWKATYAGKMPLPIWDSAYFDWQLLWRPPAQRPACVAAYDGDRLVGTLLGEEFRFRWLDREHLATQGSWLSVDPEYRRAGTAGLMLKELKRRHVERGADFQIGYGYEGSRLSLGPKFWGKYPKDTVVPKKLGFWARVLNYTAVADWELNRLEGIGARTLGWWQRGAARWTPDPNVRQYRANDLPACLELAHGLLDHVQAGIIWDRERLAHQLDYKGFPRTLVYETDGHVAGFVNYHVLDYLGRTTIRVAMIDLLAVHDLPKPAAAALVKTALRQMHDDNVALCLILKTPCFPAGVLLRTGFIPRFADQAILLTKMRPEFEVAGARRFHVLWR